MTDMYDLVQLKGKAIIVLLKPTGYYTNSGYKGRILDGSYQLFSTEEEYLEYMREEGKEMMNNVNKNN